MILKTKAYDNDKIKKITYTAFWIIFREILIYAMRIALYGELRGLKKFIDPMKVDLDEDRALLRELLDPHVQLAVTTIDYLQVEIIERYALINAVDDELVAEDNEALEMGHRFAMRYLFIWCTPRRKDRYLHFHKILLYAQRVAYELLKLSVTGETAVLTEKYRTNYSAGRVKALMLGNENFNTLLLLELINKLKEAELMSRDIR